MRNLLAEELDLTNSQLPRRREVANSGHGHVTGSGVFDGACEVSHRSVFGNEPARVRNDLHCFTCQVAVIGGVRSETNEQAASRDADEAHVQRGGTRIVVTPPSCFARRVT